MAALMAMVGALEALDVPYALGGSWASAVHGVLRATLDAHLIAGLRPEHAGPLAQALAGAFYRDRRHSSVSYVPPLTYFERVPAGSTTGSSPGIGAASHE